MPGTFTDDKCAVALAKRQGGRRNRFWLKNLCPTTLTRLLTITALAAIASISLTSRVAMACLNYPSAYAGWYDASQKACRQDEFIGSSPADFHGQSIVDRCNSWRRASNAGDYLDREWYYFLDKGQYYYLDIGQYKLLGGRNYVLGHPCYPKLYERPADKSAGYANRTVINQLGPYLRYRIGGIPSQRRNEIDTFFSGMYAPGSVPMLIYDYDIWGCYFNAGDYIDRWRYYYLDLGRYNLLDRGQYNWLGGLAYLFETPCGLWSGSFYSDLARYRPTGDCFSPEIPEPATIAILGLGAVGVLTLGKPRGAGKTQK